MDPLVRDAFSLFLIFASSEFVFWVVAVACGVFLGRWLYDWRK
jgi:hypothetical protein